ncbi:hypothetical protein SAMN05216412_105215 [Nitrosospira multiformis]|uniref:Uncharacterized protein n=1 Tax=Nitrosospira multiformis TaxID=1231 RepID=A0A1I0DW50_9PROT|nr:hypothetical protein SAMN05216412_105215 [Nitrosospira multiformis]
MKVVFLHTLLKPTLEGHTNKLPWNKLLLALPALLKQL